MTKGQAWLEGAALEVVLSLNEVRPGDEIILHNGDRVAIPARENGRKFKIRYVLRHGYYTTRPVVWHIGNEQIKAWRRPIVPLTNEGEHQA